MTSPQPARRRTGPRHLLHVAVVAAVWAVVGVAWIRLMRSTGEGPVGTMQRAIDVARDSWWALFAYLLVATVRPLVFVPATLLTAAAGMLFGPYLGLLLAVVAANASAMLGYLIGRLLRPEASAEGAGLGRWTSRIRQNSFESILLMRLIFLPYDAVNATAGVLRVGWRPFLAATALGSLPGTLAFVLAGTSIERLDAAGSGIDKRALVASLVIFVASITTARWLRRRALDPAIAAG